MSGLHKTVIVTLVNDPYVESAKQVFASAYLCGGIEADYVLLAHGGITQRDWFIKRGITVKDCQGILTGFASERPTILLSKLYLFSDYFKQWRTVIFLDSDIIVRGSLAPLQNVHGLWARKSVGLKFRFNFEDAWVTQNNFFNTGVMAFSTDAINSDTFNNLKTLATKIVKENIIDSFGTPHVSHEELVLGLYFYHRWHNLPLAFNVMPALWQNYYGLKATNIDGVIIHYMTANGFTKPWEVTNSHYQQWKHFFDASVSIDVTVPPPPTKPWSVWRIQLFELRARLGAVVYRVDCMFGVVGKFMRRLLGMSHSN